MTTFSTFVNKKKLSFFKNDHFFDIHFFEHLNKKETKKRGAKLMYLFKYYLYVLNEQTTGALIKKLLSFINIKRLIFEMKDSYHGGNDANTPPSKLRSS